MSDREDAEFVDDIRQAIARIRSYLEGVSYEVFLGDFKTQDAVIRNIEIIGEAAKAISPRFRAEHPQVPWKSMAGTRDRLIHHYFGVNLDVVWQVVAFELSALATYLDAIPGSNRRLLTDL